MAKGDSPGSTLRDRFWGGVGRGGNGFATEEDGAVGKKVTAFEGFEVAIAVRRGLRRDK